MATQRSTKKLGHLSTMEGLSWGQFIAQSDLNLHKAADTEQNGTSEKVKINGVAKKRSHEESEIMKLKREDLPVFGIHPATDSFILVVCEYCKQVVKAPALEKHIEQRHGNLVALHNIETPPPSTGSTIPSLTQTSFNSSLSRVSSSHTSNLIDSNLLTTIVIKESSNGQLQLKDIDTSVIELEDATTKVTTAQPTVPFAPIKIRIGPDPESVAGGVLAAKILTTTTTTTTSAAAAAPKKPGPPATAMMSMPTTAALTGAMTITLPQLTQPSSTMVISSTNSVIPELKIERSAPIVASNVIPNATTVVGPATTVISVPATAVSVPTGPPAIAPAPAPKVATKGKKNSSVAAGGAVREKLLPCKDREYDPNKHCGVKMAEGDKPCTRSLTCKTHSLTLRRQVQGRNKNFDDLLNEHRLIKEAALREQGKEVKLTKKQIKQKEAEQKKANAAAAAATMSDSNSQSSLASTSTTTYISSAVSTPRNAITVASSSSISNNGSNSQAAQSLLIQQQLNQRLQMKPIITTTSTTVAASSKESMAKIITATTKDNFLNSLLSQPIGVNVPPVVSKTIELLSTPPQSMTTVTPSKLGSPRLSAPPPPGGLLTTSLTPPRLTVTPPALTSAVCSLALPPLPPPAPPAPPPLPPPLPAASLAMPAPVGHTGSDGSFYLRSAPRPLSVNTFNARHVQISPLGKGVAGSSLTSRVVFDRRRDMSYSQLRTLFHKKNGESILLKPGQSRTLSVPLPGLMPLVIGIDGGGSTSPSVKKKGKSELTSPLLSSLLDSGPTMMVNHGRSPTASVPIPIPLGVQVKRHGAKSLLKARPPVVVVPLTATPVRSLRPSPVTSPSTSSSPGGSSTAANIRGLSVSPDSGPRPPSVLEPSSMSTYTLSRDLPLEIL